MKPKNGIELVDRSVALARGAVFPHLWAYYLGAVPCVLAFLYFINDMSAAADAELRLVVLSGLLAASFVWMKIWQAVFGLRVHETLMDLPHRKIAAGEIIRCIAWQALLGPAGLVAIPIALVLTLPFGWCYAFFQTATVMYFVNDKDAVSEARRLAFVRPAQNHLFLWIVCPVSLLVMCCTIIFIPLCARFFGDSAGATAVFIALSAVLGLMTLAVNPFGGILFANITAALAAMPLLLKILFGVETVYSMSPQTLLHPGLLMTVWSLCFLIMDPIVKIGYILRAYDDHAVGSGSDLLKRLGAMTPMLVVSAILFMPAPVSAGGTPERTALDQSIQNVLEKPVYSWRDKRTMVSVSSDHDKKKSGLFARFSAGVKKVFKKIARWIVHALRYLLDNPPDAGGSGRRIFPRLVSPHNAMVALAVGVGLVLLLLLLRTARRRARLAAVTVPPTAAVPDSEKELDVVSAEDNPPDKWEVLALSSLASGDARAAIRFLFLSTLSLMGERNIIHLRKSRSNRVYRREVQRRFPDIEELNASFGAIVTGYECAWFGRDESGSRDAEIVVQSHRRIKEFITRHA